MTTIVKEKVGEGNICSDTFGSSSSYAILIHQ